MSNVSMKWMSTALSAFAIFIALASLSVHETKAAPGTGTLFGTDTRTGEFITVDLMTGNGTVVGPTGLSSVPSLAVDHTTGIVYLGQGGGSAILHTVDPATGVATFLGDPGLGFGAIAGMDFSVDGVLYAAVNIVGDGRTGGDHLAILDKSTGELISIVGDFGNCGGVDIPSSGAGSCDLDGFTSIAFAPSGTLWGVHRGNAPGEAGLYVIDLDSGNASFVAPILDDSEAPPSRGVASLQFGCDGIIYGGTNRAGFPATDGGKLITIDAVTGLFTFVGAGTATSGGALGGLAFQDLCDRDGDGIPDTEDACTDSDLSHTVVIDGCDSDVDNELFDDGCTIADLVMECAEGAHNHGKFVKCVAHLTNDLKKDGTIIGREKGAVQSCSAQANIP